ncbi:hypothetical protein SNE40_007696 [Patella caerulea]|uniref:Uncharacterized protein n=1 Tax=Patella caerulea TaxID=87958 RepID=A0AAN8Q2P6_PATCE
MALANNNTANETKRRDIAMQLFEAYSAMSCCFINDQLIIEAMLPGLRCLKQDMALIATEHEEVVVSMIKEYETKMDTNRMAERSGSISSVNTMSAEDVRQRVMSKFKDSNISNIFSRKK